MKTFWVTCNKSVLAEQEVLDLVSMSDPDFPSRDTVCAAMRENQIVPMTYSVGLLLTHLVATEKLSVSWS